MSSSSFLGSKALLGSSPLSTERLMAESTLNMSLTVKQYIKQLANWYKGWHRWQRRIAICRMVEHCSPPHLRTLSTSLEPVLHLDFANSLNPLMAALHQEGSNLFKIHRAAVIESTSTRHGKKKQAKSPPPPPPPPVAKEKTKEAIVGRSRKLALSRLTPQKEEPAHVTAGEVLFNSMTAEKQTFFPALPLSHPKHKPSPASSDTGKPLFLSLPPIERKFNSVPNITAVNSRHGPKIRRARHHPRTITFQHHKDLNAQQEQWMYQKKRLEAFKTQLTMISEVTFTCTIHALTCNALGNIMYNLMMLELNEILFIVSPNIENHVS